MLFLRALLAFLALPATIGFVVPLSVAWETVRTGSPRVVAVVPFASGVILLLWCVREFYAAGKGTLAPWDPPRHLVTRGPYRLSRNPMYVAMSLVLVGWAAGYGTRALWIYAAGMVLAFHARILLGEEPTLARRFGEEWTRYKADVPRWLIRRTRIILVGFFWLQAIDVVSVFGPVGCRSV